MFLFRLKAEGREENANTIHAKERVKCSACSCPYSSPVTSVQCWHVHCEKCWLEALVSIDYIISPFNRSL